MCGGVEAREADRIWRIYFPNPKAALPVLDENGQLEWITWGRRKGEPGNGPQGGWARADTIARGGWAKYRPILALALVQRFMEKEGTADSKGKRASHWFDVPTRDALECLIHDDGGRRRAYIVTTTPPAEYQWIHDRWPQMARLPHVA